MQNQTDAQYIFHTSDIKNLLTENGNQKFENISIIKNGDNYIVKCEPNIASTIKRNLDNVQGESITFAGNRKDAFEFLSKFDFEIVLTENVGGVYTLYAYVPVISNCIYVNNQKVNLEQAIKCVLPMFFVGLIISNLMIIIYFIIDKKQIEMKKITKKGR